MDMIRVTVESQISDEGTLMIFSALTDDGDEVIFGMDDMEEAENLACSLLSGEQPQIEIESSQVMS